MGQSDCSKYNVLFLIDTPIEGDLRVTRCRDVYAEIGCATAFLNVRQLEFWKTFKLRHLAANLLEICFLLWRWIYYALRTVPKYRSVWKSKKLSNYDLLRLNLPSLFWRDTFVYYMKGLGYGKLCPEKFKKINRIHAHDLGALAFAVAVARRHPHLDITYDAHELSAFRNRRRLSWLSGLLITAFETAAIQRTSNVISVCPPILAWLRYFAGGAGRRYHLVCNNFFSGNKLDVAHGSGEGVVIFYIGSLIYGRGLQRLTKIAEDNPGISVHLFSPEDNPNQRRYAKEYERIQNVKAQFGAYTDGVRKIIEKSGSVCSWLWLDDVCLSYRFAFPNKLFQYAAFGVPVICPDGFFFSKIVRQYGIDVHVDHLKRLNEEIAETQLEQIAANGHRLVADYAAASYEVVIPKLFRCIRDETRNQTALSI